MLDTSNPRTCHILSVTAYRPCLRKSPMCRHRLGFTVSGDAELPIQSYAPKFQTGLPSLLVMMGSARLPRNPRSANSRSRPSSIGSCAAMLRWAAMVASDAGLASCAKAPVADAVLNKMAHKNFCMLVSPPKIFLTMHHKAAQVNQDFRPGIIQPSKFIRNYRDRRRPRPERSGENAGCPAIRE